MTIDPNSADWIAIRRAINDDIAELATSLEADQPEVVTAKARGAISALRAIIKKVEAVPDLPIPTIDYLRY